MGFQGANTIARSTPNDANRTEARRDTQNGTKSSADPFGLEGISRLAAAIAVPLVPLLLTIFSPDCVSSRSCSNGLAC